MQMKKGSSSQPALEAMAAKHAVGYARSRIIKGTVKSLTFALVTVSSTVAGSTRSRCTAMCTESLSSVS